MFCPHCGNQLDGQVTFCPFCGQRVAPEPEPDAPAQPTDAYPGATAQYPAQAAYQQQAGQGTEGPDHQQPADAAQQPAAEGAPQGRGEKKGPSAVTVVLAVVAVVAVLALALVATGVVDLGSGDDATEATAEATVDADDADADSADDATEATTDADDATDTTDDDATDTSDTDVTIDATTDDTSDATSGRSSASSGSAEATAASLLALLEAEGFDDVYVSDEYGYAEAYMYGDALSDTWEFSVMIEADGSLSDVDIYVYWPIDGDVEEGFAHADEVLAYVFDLLADGGYLDDWEDMPDATFPDEFVAEAVEFAAGLTESDSFYESTETDEGYDLWLWYYYAPGYDYVCMNYEASR